jgi:hypothetical protein
MPLMKICIKEKNNKENLKELVDNHGKFELTKQQISKGNILQLQIGNKKLSIIL